MPHLLLFEIWENPEDGSFEMSPATERGDELRRQIAPKSVLRHSFRAESDFEGYQLNYDWHGWGRWNPEPDWTEQKFTAAEVASQERYLAVRNVG
jgi:hypothetical protein